MAELEQTAVFAINLDPEGHLRWLEPDLDPDLTFARWAARHNDRVPGKLDQRLDARAWQSTSVAATPSPWAYTWKWRPEPARVSSIGSWSIRHGPTASCARSAPTRLLPNRLRRHRPDWPVEARPDEDETAEDETRLALASRECAI